MMQIQTESLKPLLCLKLNQHLSQKLFYDY